MATQSMVKRAIARAEMLLPGTPAPQGERDARWHAIIGVGAFVVSHPEEVWGFALRWGKHAQSDLRAAVGTCLLEHLLQHHFERLFPRVRDATMKSTRLADCYRYCSWSGDSALPKNRARLRRLETQLRRKWSRSAVAYRRRRESRPRPASPRSDNEAGSGTT